MKSSQHTALIIDDEVQIRRLLRTALESSGYRVVGADCGERGISEVAIARPDVVILDMGLPDMDGVEVLKRLREWSRVPVLVASVRDEARDKIAALNAGADDYVSKPFDTAELIARLQAIQRRVDPAHEISEFVAGKLRLDYVARLVIVSGREVHFTPIEYELLRMLARNAGKVVTQPQLLRDIWGPSAEEKSQYLRVHFTHIRHKLSEAGFDVKCLRTEPGVGYRLTVNQR